MKRLLTSSPRYLAVSALCMMLNVGLLISFARIGVHYVISVLVSGAVLIPISYVLHQAWTYRVEGGRTSFGRYFGAQIVNSPIALLLFFIVYDRAGLAMEWAAPTVIATMFVYNFLSSFWAIALWKPRTSG